MFLDFGRRSEHLEETHETHTRDWENLQTPKKGPNYMVLDLNPEPSRSKHKVQFEQQIYEFEGLLYSNRGPSTAFRHQNEELI